MLHDALHAVHSLPAMLAAAWHLMSPEFRFLLALPWGIAALALLQDAVMRAHSGSWRGGGRR